MAQVGRCAIWILLLALASVGWAQDATVPAEGIRAETEKRWDDAIAIYQKALRADPTRADLWIRIADIHAARKEAGPAADAMENAARLRPRDAGLQRRMSQAMAVADRKEKALEGIRRAVALDPRNAEYLRAQAELASWNDDPRLVAESDEALLRIDPVDGTALVGLARARARLGDLDDAVDLFERYVASHPEDADALLSYADAEIYRGAYDHAEGLQDRYRESKGETAAFRRARANLRARSGRPTEALHITSDLLAGAEDDFDLNLIRTIALNAGRRPRAARQGLATLDRLGPDRKETSDAHLLVETPLRAEARVGASAAAYSDSIHEIRLELGGGISPTPATRLSVGSEVHRMGAHSGSGLDPETGGRYIELDQGWGRFRDQVLPCLAVEVGAGWADNERGNGTLTYLAAVEVHPDDRLLLRLERQHDVLAMSPRTIDLFVERDVNRLSMSWQPCYDVAIDAELRYDRHDDGNRAYQATFAPRLAIQRSQRLNLDAGLRAQAFHYAEDRPGYYDPDEYLRLRAMLYAYWKISDSDGVGVVMGLGPERDRDLDHGFKLGAGASIEGTFGIYRDWQVRVHAGYDWRAGSNAIEGGGFNGRSAGIEILVRF